MPESAIPTLLREVRQTLEMQRETVSHFVTKANCENQPDRVHETLSMLLRYYLDRGAAVLSLLEIRLDWDAEIVLRTCYECAVKILFIALNPRSDRESLVWEFWVPLGEAGDRKAARKASFAEKGISHTDEGARDALRLLRDPRMIRARLGLSKKTRRHLEQKWSFSELVEALTELHLGDQKLVEARTLLHNYGMASHLAHADSKALDLMMDRTLRSSDELRALQDGHAARIASDLIGIGNFCIHAVFLAENTRDSPLRDLRRKAETILAIKTEIDRIFYDSQRSFYDNMRSEPVDTDE